jgi:iron complex transport system substrate-binding protein
MRPERPRFRTTPFVVVLALTAACGSSSARTTPPTVPPTTTPAATPASTVASTPSPSTAAAVAYPVTIHAANGPVLIAEQPKAIVSLSPTATEMLFAIGAGDQVTAVDDQSDYPPEAPRSKLSGYQPNVEAIAAQQPDLVVIAGDTNGLTASLKKLKIPVLSLPAVDMLDDVYTELEQLGVATGHVGGAAEEVSRMKTEIDTILKGLPAARAPLTYYHELDNTYYSVTSKTFIGQIYSLLGLKNIADAADKGGTGYPQLSQEYIIQSDPDLIFLADTKCCGQSAATVKARPGWNQIKAVRAGYVVALDDAVASRWGPRIVDFLRAVAAAVAKVRTAPTG